MFSKNRISAFKAKVMDKHEVTTKRKIPNKSKGKRKTEPVAIDLESSQTKEPSIELKVSKKRGKKSKKIKNKMMSKGGDMLHTGKPDSAKIQDVTIEVSDDESDSCMIVEESLTQDGKKLGNIEESCSETKESLKHNKSGNTAEHVKKISKSGGDEKAVHQVQDTITSDSSGINHKRKQSNVNKDARNKTKKKSKMDTAEERSTIDESAGWSKVNLRIFALANADNAGVSTPDQDEEVKFADSDNTGTKSPAAISVAGSVLIIASHPCTFPLKGRVKIQALVGTASIMGYQLLPGKECCDVFSPECNSLITVATVMGQTDVKKSEQEVVSALGPSDGNILKELRKTLTEYQPYVIFKFDKIESNLCSFISTFPQYTNIFKVDGDRSSLNKQLLPLSVIVPGDSEVPTLYMTDQLQSVIDEWKATLGQDHRDPPVMMVCGGKDSGKSTTNRHLINTALNVLESVYYLECDIGQTEFTPPGVVSLVEVTSPVFGPPFTHQRKSLCSYHFGGVSPKDNPDLYMQCVQLCVGEYMRLQKSGPLIVNTMGWMKGLGWQLLLDTVRLVSPSIIVQLKSNQNSQNIDPITVGSLKEESWTDLSQMYQGPGIERRMKRIPKIVHIDMPVSTSYNFRMRSTDYRNLSILCHLGDNLEPGLTLTSVTPYTVKWKDAAIHMCHIEVPRTQVMYALNANLIALCEGDITQAEEYIDDGPLFLTGKGPCKWLGYGIVRGIDMEKKEFYIITSMTEEELARVNVLDIGGVSLPENFLVSQKCEKMVYVDEVVDSVGLSAVRPRKHMPRKGLRGTLPR